jgi:hypothetical protein
MDKFLHSVIGSRWSQTFKEAVKSPFDEDSDLKEDAQIDSSPESAMTPDNEYYQLMFNLYLVTCYQATNYAEAYMTQKHLEATKILKNQERTFEMFFHDAENFTTGKGYQVVNMNLFKQVVRTFYFYAQNEYENILKKI